MDNKITPQQKMMLFKQATMRHWQEIGTAAGAEGGQVQFVLPKSRLLSKLKLRVKLTLTATHAANTSYTAHEDAPFSFLRRVELQMNNQVSPFNVSGKGLVPYEYSVNGAEAMKVQSSGRYPVVMPVVASAGGTANAVSMTLDLPVVTNDQELIGLILLQNDQTQAVVNITLGTLADLAPASAGYTFAVTNIVVSLMAETFSIPAIADAFPDISVAKMVSEISQTVVAGENLIKLPTGLIYRKIALQLYNDTPVRLADSNITSNIELIVNQADFPVRITPYTLADENTKLLEAPLPGGTYLFDFSNAGKTGSRDYIDTERVTEFWIKFSSDTAGSVRVVYETLSRLKGIS